MPACYLMSWEPTNARWWKMYRRRRYVVSCRQLNAPATKEGSYQAANAWWRAKKAEIDGQQPVHPFARELDTLKVRRDWAQRHGDPEVAGNLAQEVDRVETGGEPHESWKFHLKVYQQLFGLNVGSTPPELLRHLFDGSDQLWDDRLEHDGNNETGSDELTIAAQVNRWAETQLARVRAGERSAAGHDNDLVCLRHLQEFLGAGTSIKNIDEGRWTAFYRHLLEKVGERGNDPGAEAGWSRDYANKVFRVADPIGLQVRGF
jgi:hypothetical protein